MTRRATSAAKAPLVWRVLERPEGLVAVPVGGGGAWPGFEMTRRAKLAARTARGRASAHRHTKHPGPVGRTKRPGPTVPRKPVAPQATLEMGRRPPARQACLPHSKARWCPEYPWDPQ
mgnify:CR=1 FL=1